MVGTRRPTPTKTFAPCQLTNIHTLKINGSTEITDTALQHMRNLPLEKLSLNLCAITDNGLQLLRDNMPHMRKLDIQLKLTHKKMVKHFSKFDFEHDTNL
jgi:hypothetical protein